MHKKYFLEGERVALKQMETREVEKLSELIVKWVNDGLVTYYMFTGQQPKNQEQIKQEINKQLSEDNDIVFLVLDKETSKPIGYAGLYEINQSSRKAEFRILIGEIDFWGKGLGTEITELLVYYGFDRLNLNRIYLGFTADNQAAKRAYEKSGFQYEGTLKQDIYRNSQYYDSARMAILRDDYYKEKYKEHKTKFSIK